MRPITTLVLCLAFGAMQPAAAAVSDPNWTETTFSTNAGGGGHTGLAWAPDGSDRLFVLEKNGRVRLLSGSLAGTPAWSTFATMSPIFTNSECGLIGMAFDPDFVNNQYVYFFVTVSNSEQQILRYDASGATGTDRTIIRSGLPTSGNNHDGGGLGFAADDKLYWSIGDLGNGTGVDADLTSLAAKVGRANRDGTPAPGNPFDDGAGPNDEFLFARGFRNPFTMQIQPATGELWLNVVGTSYEQIFVVRAGDHGGYNDYENNQPAGFITPKIVYRTNGVDTRTITAAARSGDVSTFTTSAAHRFRVGSNLTIAGVADPSFNQANLYVVSVPSDTTFTASQPGPAVSSSGGSATTLDQGGCLTGGAFYDATLAAPSYRGNFFYGDCNSGRIMRARIDPESNAVLGINYWGTGIASQVDIDSGPDGALYYTGVGTSNIYRAAFNPTAPGLVIANQHLRLDEGGAAVTTVRLATAPAADVSVTVARIDGDTDIGVAAGAALTFTPANWMRPQAVRLQVQVDTDASDDVATVLVSAAGMTAVPITASVYDPQRISDHGFE